MHSEIVLYVVTLPLGIFKMKSYTSHWYFVTFCDGRIKTPTPSKHGNHSENHLSISGSVLLSLGFLTRKESLQVICEAEDLGIITVLGRWSVPHALEWHGSRPRATVSGFMDCTVGYTDQEPISAVRRVDEIFFLQNLRRTRFRHFFVGFGTEHCSKRTWSRCREKGSGS